MSLSPRLCPVLPLLVLLTLALSPGAAQAQAAEDPGFGSELSLFEEIPSVFGASKYEQKVSEAPSSVSIITAAEIQRYGYRTLADILRSVRGFHVNNDHNYEYVAVRGFGRPGDYNTRLLVMVDGHRINENIFGLAGIGRDFLLDVDLIERVEIIRGPSSSLYGTGAFFGVVNVITRRGEQLDGVELSAAAASYDSYGGRLSYGRKFGGAEALLSGSLFASNGDDWYFPEYNDTARNLDGEEAWNLFLSVAHGPFTLSGALAERKKDVPTAPFGTDFNSRTQTTDERGYLNLAYAQELTDNLDVSGRAFFDSYRYDGEYPYLPDIFRDYAYGEWLGIEAQTGYRAGRQHLITGGEFRASYREDQGAYTDPLAPDFIDHRHSSYWALFLQDEIELSDWARLTLGLRHDDYSTFGGSTNPRAALILSPKKSTTLKLLYSEAFRAPNNFELFYDDNGTSQKANPDLEPEEITTYEVILEHYFNDDVRGLIGAFHNETENLIELVEDPGDLLLVYQNRGEVKARGVEAELEAKLTSGVTGRASYTYQKAIDKATDSRLTNSPLHLAKLNLTLPLLREKFFLGVEEQFTSSRKTVLGGEVGSFTVTNLTFSGRKVAAGLDFQVSVFNLFDREYADTAGEEHSPLSGIPQHGRTGRVELTYAF